MKLIIQIPCYNEEKTLPLVLSEIPEKIEWIDQIETMIIDDGSGDRTIEVAKDLWVDHIISHIGNKWLGVAFRSGVERALELWADILVNTDWDNQYPSRYIWELVKPIIEKKAEIVIWDRQTSKVSHFSILKKILQWFGSFLVRLLSGTDVPDTVSGFRAYSRESLYRLNITSRFSYVLDTIMQAGSKWLETTYITIETNPPTRPSRLFKNIWQHIRKSTFDLIRVFVMYHPIRFFFVLWIPFLFVGSIWVIRFLYYFLQFPDNTGKIQSLVLSGVFILVAIQFFALGIIWDMIAKNRSLIEENLYLSKKSIYDKKNLIKK